ncbi:hypothetical protein HY635_02745 [Candidatus Uhrbacteria bacterium]|nr:hypothetical protein [Candidatus Uhrbacteria bacterium]
MREIHPMRAEIAGAPALALREEGIEYRRVLLLDLRETPSIVIDNLSALQHAVHEAGAASDDLDVQAAAASVARFPETLGTIDLEPLSVKLGQRIHRVMEDPEMVTEGERVQALHTVYDDPRLKRFRDTLGDASLRLEFVRSVRPELDSIQQFLEGTVDAFTSGDSKIREFAEAARAAITAKAAPGTELHRELIGEFMGRLRRFQ